MRGGGRVGGGGEGWGWPSGDIEDCRRTTACAPQVWKVDSQTERVNERKRLLSLVSASPKSAYDKSGRQDQGKQTFVPSTVQSLTRLGMVQGSERR